MWIDKLLLPEIITVIEFEIKFQKKYFSANKCGDNNIVLIGYGFSVFWIYDIIW